MNIKKQNPWVCSLLFPFTENFQPLFTLLGCLYLTMFKKMNFKWNQGSSEWCNGNINSFLGDFNDIHCFVVIYFCDEVLNMFWSCEPFLKGCDGRKYLRAEVCKVFLKNLWYWLKNDWEKIICFIISIKISKRQKSYGKYNILTEPLDLIGFHFCLISI